MRKLLLVIISTSVVAAWAERQPYSRYKTIVEREMFGPAPADFDPSKMPSEVSKTKAKSGAELTKEQEQVKKAIRFSVLNVTSDGEIVVGFTDSGDAKNPLHYYLKVGETQNGWTVKEADKDEATMTVEKDGIEVTLKLGGDSASGAGSVSRVAAAAPSSRAGGNLLFGGSRSLRERRLLERQQLQEDEAKREAAEKERKAREEEEKKVREAEREDQRKQLLQIQEELRKAREAREMREKEKENESEDANSENSSEN